MPLDGSKGSCFWFAHLPLTLIEILTSLLLDLVVSPRLGQLDSVEKSTSCFYPSALAFYSGIMYR